VNAVLVLFIALTLQRVIYQDWLHRGGSLRLVGSGVAAVLTFVYSYRLQSAERRRKLELLRSFETIAWANDRIRNALQAIECVTYFHAPASVEPVRQSVEVIASVLHHVLATADPESSSAAGKASDGSQIASAVSADKS
jgi:hypothetical protein